MCVIMCHSVFNVLPKTTLLPAWPREAKRLDTAVYLVLLSLHVSLCGCFSLCHFSCSLMSCSSIPSCYLLASDLDGKFYFLTLELLLNYFF